MNEQDHLHTELEVADSDPAHGGLDRFTNPGLPAHKPRYSDLSEAGARRAERQVAALFSLSILATLGFLVAFFAVPTGSTVYFPGAGEVDAVHLTLGVTLGVALLSIGLGAVHWAKTLMPDEEVVELRHPMRSSDDARQEVVSSLKAGGAGSQITRRPLIKYTLGGALGLFSLPLLVQLVVSLGPLPHKALSLTFWNGGPSGPGDNPTFKPLRLMRDPENTPLKASDVEFGSFVHVLPEGLLDLKENLLEEKAKASVVVMRLDPSQIKSSKELDWSYNGIIAYSNICTHAGCPVSLYEHSTENLLCPCHQSTFDVTEDCRVIFGPADRPLPQLKITVDAEGYLISAQPFDQAVGPSFWSRG